MGGSELLFLGEDQVRDVLSYDILIPAMRQALMDFSAGRVIQPLRTVMAVSGHCGVYGAVCRGRGQCLESGRDSAGG